ncbi:hypothetical protein ACWDUZ_35030, partial [Streptomyces sp. NPDC003393]
AGGGRPAPRRGRPRARGPPPAGSGARGDARPGTVSVRPPGGPCQGPLGIIPITAPDFYHAFPETARIVLDSGISTGCVVAVLLNLIFNHLGKDRDAEEVTHPTEAGEEIAESVQTAPAH